MSHDFSLIYVQEC